MKIYVINLDRAPERWAEVSAEAARVGVTLDRVSAVDAACEEGRTQLPKITTGPVSQLGLGTLACSASHAAVWAKIAEGDAPAVVLEDDVELSDDFSDVIEAISSKMNGYDLIKLEDFGTVHDGLLCGDAMTLTARRGLRWVYHLATGSAGYVLSPRGAKQLLAEFGRCAVPIDHFLFYPKSRAGFGGLPFSIVDPPVVIQKPDQASTIAGARGGEHEGRVRLWQAVRRGLYELSPAGYMLRALLKGARVRKLKFER